MKSERLIVWGTGATYQMFKDTLFEIVNVGEDEIVALVNKEGSAFMDGYPVICAQDVTQMEYDRILICAEGKMAASIKSDMQRLGIDDACAILCPEYLTDKGAVLPTYEFIINKQCEVLKKIIMASDEQVKSYKWMYKAIAEYGVYPFRGLKEPGITWSQWGVMQTIEEFAQYCNYIADLEVGEAVEVGVFKGRSSYIMCALLSRKNPNLHYICADIYDNLDSFERYHEILPALDKKIPSTSEDYKDKEFDFVFIDADHSYDASYRDFVNLGAKAKKVTIFHDIYGHEYDKLNGGVAKTWKEVVRITSSREHKIFSSYPDQWMGIGVVVW